MTPKRRVITLLTILLVSATLGYAICRIPVLGLREDHESLLLGTISVVNAALVLATLVLYARLYLQTKTRFSLGLSAFAMLMLLQVLTSSPLALAASTPVTTPTNAVSTLCTTGAFAFLLYASLE